MARFLSFLMTFAVLACGPSAPSDEELLEQFVRDVTGRVDEGLVTRALGYTAFEQLPIDVKAPGHAGVYREDRAKELETGFRTGLSRFLWDSEIRVRSKKIQITGDQATVDMRLLTHHGPLRAETELQKLAGGWKVKKVHLIQGF